MAEEKKGWASVSALANTGFGFMLFLNGFFLTGIVPEADTFGLMTFSMFFLVGLGYLIAGIIELKRGQANTGYVILVYSMFGFLTGFIYLLSTVLAIMAYPTPTVWLIYWIFWIFISIISGIILTPIAKMVSINLYWLAITFALFAIAGYGNLAIAFIAGIVAFAQGFYNWYIVAAVVILETHGRPVLPLR